jgi:cellobiose-specific phosphotransferase system component IIB
MLSLAIFSCKNSEEKNKETEVATTENVEKTKAYKGDFINSDGALVLMGPNFIYGVKRDEISEELSKQVEAVKKNDYDMVGVIVRGIVSKNNDKENEWEEEITIKEIMKVNDKPSEVDIKLNETAKKN